MSKKIRDLRIFHILSPVKWDGDTFDSKSDSNWKVCEKTILFLPDCHHYILVPIKHNISLRADNITFIKYDYPTSVQLNRGMFDHRRIHFDFTRVDVDFVFLHQPELTFNIHQWFHTNRYYEDVSYFGFYHWIDCKQSRGSVSGCPSFYMRQLESMHISDAKFVHSDNSMIYMESNFKERFDDLCPTYYMPLSSTIDAIEPTQFDLPKKKILLFNHRWNESSGIKKLIDYTDGLSPEEYTVWVTDEDCPIKNHLFFVKSLSAQDYSFLVQNCYASLCFIDGYCTWNLAVQDSLILGTPLLYYHHATIKKVVGAKYKGNFKNKAEFIELLENLPEIQSLDYLKNHDLQFKEQLHKAISDKWKDTAKEPKDAARWIECINEGVVDKKAIANAVNDKVRLNSTAHFVRRHLLHNGVRDNIKSPYTEYFIEGNPKTIKVDLFSGN